MGSVLKHGAIGALIVIAMLALLIWLLPLHVLAPMAVDFAKHQVPSLSLGDVGDFFNFTYGLPVAIMGAILGALATFVAGVFALRQGDVDILVFIESKTNPAIKLYRRLVDAIGNLNVCGNEARNLGAQLFAQIQREGGPNASPLAHLLYNAPDDFDDIDSALEYIRPLENEAHRNLLAGAFFHVQAVRDSLSTVADIFQEIETDFYASYFSRRQMRDTTLRRPMDHLRAILPADLVPASYLLDDLPSLTKGLRHRAATNDLFAPVRASAFAPDDALTIDYLGLVLTPLFQELQFPKPFEHEGKTGKIFGYVINLGAAQLLSIVKTVPHKKTIETAFREIFPNRSRVAMNFLHELLPERDALGPPYILGSIDPEFAALHKLVLVDVLWNGRRQIAFHNPRVHGSLPATGYREPGDEPRTESVRHNEKGAALASRAFRHSSLG